MNILLVDPPGKNKGLNTGLAYLTAILKKNHRIHVLDLNNLQMGLCGDPNPDLSQREIQDKIWEAIDRFAPDLFGVSVKTFTAHTATSIFSLAREKRKDMVTVAGGPHITLDGASYLQKSGIDFGISGEGESSLPDLCRALTDGKEFASVNGLLHRQGDRIIENPTSPAYGKLDELPFPDYSSFDSVQNNGGMLPQYPILTSRGCPFSCSYCSMPTIMGKRWRCHTAEYVIQELMSGKKNYGSTSFTVVDDCFTLDLKRVEAISDQLISSRLDLRWNSQNGIRADRINKTVAEKMRRSGCYHVWIGIESADERVFKAINKGEKLENIRKGITILKKAGIRVGGFFIVGLPHSTRESDLKSVAFVRKLGIDAWWFNFVPYPHTAAWTWVKDNAKILRSPEGILQYGSSDIELVFETDNYSEEERKATYKEIHFKMGYFDRLFDPTLSNMANFRRLIEQICAEKPAALFPFFLFVLKYSLKGARKTLRETLPTFLRVS